ncbi:MAG: hypothetical protein K1X83_12345 [Oligoflexia bacterium]|nr:hypothetical protein [Oligoflexia bacterium]
MALSADNPYLAGNLLVSKEMERSPELKGFVQHRGAPTAVEVRKDAFGPLLMNFFYPETRQYYNLEEIEGGWIINGPLTIEPERMTDLMRLSRSTSEPIDAAQALQHPEPSPAPTTSPPPLKSFHPELVKPPPTAPASFKSPLKSRPRAAPPAPELPAAPVGLESIIAAAPDRSAEISPRGDLVHYVTYPGETLSVLARWYTLDRQNAARLARINKMTNPDELAVGDIVVIPSYLTHNQKLLTAEALKALQQIAQSER